ncbi:MAG TPA: YicC/YloC family endoribonuclease [Gemmatimonadales bacterium]|nr:YicC/YloC family endoribonuclease [Gemmatimonadales bacterium]
MAYSMTGYGAAEGQTARGTLRIEIRTVNHRFLNVALKLPSELLSLEAELREALRRDFERGHVAVSARWLGSDDSVPRVTVDLEHARQVALALRDLQSALGLGGELDLALVARQPDVLTRNAIASEPPVWDEIAPIVAAATEACRVMREREGAALTQDILERLDHLDAAAREISALAPARLVRERDRLRKAVSELLEGRAMDETRLAQELAVNADRLDVTEELVRFRTHTSACRETLGGAEPVGKQLGFLAQEMGREVNTVGSKANDADIARLVIGMKGELEKIREQLENLE